MGLRKNPKVIPDQAAIQPGETSSAERYSLKYAFSQDYSLLPLSGTPQESGHLKHDSRLPVRLLPCNLFAQVSMPITCLPSPAFPCNIFTLFNFIWHNLFFLNRFLLPACLILFPHGIKDRDNQKGDQGNRHPPE
jgi:hypothetical protein